MGITCLPEEVVDLILTYLPPFSLVWLNRKLYCEYHWCIKSHIQTPFLNYVRRMIERDHDFVFANILKENIDTWLQNREYAHKNMIFNNGIYFIQHFCYEHKSDKCRQLVKRHLDERNLTKNRHKKNIVKYISNGFHG